MTKTIFIIFDGIGDRPIKQLNSKTPLEAAKTPNLDKLAKKGVTGMVDIIGVGKRPGSDVAHLILFGYPIWRFYHGRGPFECAGIEMDPKPGDVAIRCNLGTVDNKLNIIDRRAGRISNVQPFVKNLNMTIDDVKFIIKAGTAHRAGLIMRGKGLSHKISDADPHKTKVRVNQVKPLDKSVESKFTATVLNKYLQKCYELLNNNPENKKLKLKANFLLTRGAGFVSNFPSFQKRYGLNACCIAGAGLYKGISKMVGMDILKVEGATGLPTTNVFNKVKAAKKALKKYDYAFIHIKAADNLAEDGNFKGKKAFLERADKAFKQIQNEQDTLIVITGDHSTSSTLKAHTGDPVPILFTGPGVRVDKVNRFSERACSRGNLHRIKGLDVMQEIMNLLGKQRLVGD